MRSYRAIAIVLITSLVSAVFTDCQDHVELYKTRELKFAVSGQHGVSGGRAKGELLKSVIVTIRASNGVIIADRIKLELYLFGADYLSSPLTLHATEELLLTEFLVLDDNNSVTYASPREGSPLEHLVEDPLDIEFKIAKNEITTLTPEVIAVDEGRSASDFGYAQFGFKPVENIDVVVSSFIKRQSTLELTASHIIFEALPAENAETSLWTFGIDLENRANNIVLRKAPFYRITATKAGYQNWIVVRTLADTEAIEIIFKEHAEQKRLTGVFGKDGNGVVYRYNNSNQVIETSSSGNQGVPNIKFYYDETGQLIRSEHFQSGELFDTRRYLYNPNGQLQYIEGKRDQELIYGSNGLPSEMILKDGYFDYQERAIYKYDTEGNLIQIKIYGRNEFGENTWITTENYSYDDQKPISGSSIANLLPQATSYHTSYYVGYFPYIPLKHNIIRVEFSTYFDWYGDEEPNVLVVSSEFTYSEGLPVNETVHNSAGTLAYYPSEGVTRKFSYE